MLFPKVDDLWTGGVRTLIALHHDGKTKSETFILCRGQVNISCSSKLAWINMKCMRIHCLLPFLRKFKSVWRPARLLLFLRDKFVVRRHLKRFRKNRDCSLAQESIHLAAVTRTADGCVNNIKIRELFSKESTLDMPTYYKETVTF